MKCYRNDYQHKIHMTIWWFKMTFFKVSWKPFIISTHAGCQMTLNSELLQLVITFRSQQRLDSCLTRILVWENLIELYYIWKTSSTTDIHKREEKGRKTGPVMKNLENHKMNWNILLTMNKSKVRMSSLIVIMIVTNSETFKWWLM